MSEPESKPRLFSLSIRIQDDEQGNAAFSCDGQFLGHLISYALIALHPYLFMSEEQGILADAITHLPEDHPAHKLVKLTNRAVSGDD